jgi:hypothetical protein
MKRSSGARQTVHLPESVNRRLNMYALAAGVGALALAQPAEAKVVYTPAHKWLPLNHAFYLDLNHDGMNDFRFLLHSRVWSTGFSRSLVVEPQSNNGVFGYPCSVACGSFVHVAVALPKGKRIGPERPFVHHTKAFMFYSGNGDAGSRSFGAWLNSGRVAYLGFRFAIKGEVHYGWARVGNVDRGHSPKAELMGYAYETIPDKTIIAGKTKGPDVITARPATLGKLALGRK